MNKGEGETKQGAKKMALFFIYPLSLISARNRTDRKQGDGVTKLVAKLYISPLSLPNFKKPILLFTDRCPSSSSGNRLSLILRFEATKKNNR